MISLWDRSWTWRLEVRVLLPWLVIPVTVGLLCGLLDLGLSFYVGHLGVADQEDLRKSLVYGEMLLPLIVGWAGTRVVLGDQARDLVAVTVTPPWQLYLRRLFLILLAVGLVWTLAFGAVTLVLQVGSQTLLARRIWIGGLVAAFFFGSCGYAASLALHNALIGAGVTTVLWGSALMSIQAAPDLALFHPFLTYAEALHPTWIVNRLLLCSTAVLLLGWGSWHLRHLAWMLPAPTEDTQ